MPYFEIKHEIYLLIAFVIIPLLSCFWFYKKNPKWIWLSMVAIVILFIAETAIFYPYLITDIVTSNYDFTTWNWIIFFGPTILLVAFVATFLTYIVAIVRKKLQ